MEKLRSLEAYPQGGNRDSGLLTGCQNMNKSSTYYLKVCSTMCSCHYTLCQHRLKETGTNEYWLKSMTHRPKKAFLLLN